MGKKHNFQYVNIYSKIFTELLCLQRKVPVIEGLQGPPEGETGV